MSSSIDSAIIQAYLETDYRVYGANPFTLKVGVTCPALAQLYKTHAITNSAFITACNPFSKLLDATDNAARHAKLGQRLKQHKFIILEGIGKHPTSDWPGESSFLILGVNLETARTLANQLKQNAFIWNSDDAVPQLILLR